MRASTRPTGMNDDFAISRRLLLSRIGAGIPATALVAMLGDKSRAAWLPRPHFAPRAKHVIHLFMNGGPSQVDTFDPKPALAKHRGDRPQAIRGRKTERCRRRFSSAATASRAWKSVNCSAAPLASRMTCA